MPNVQCSWKEKMAFSAKTGGHEILMDAKSPIGSDSAMSPKELLLAGVCGCTAMDVVALLKKYKQPLAALNVNAEAKLTEGVHPAIFQNIAIRFEASGELEVERLLEAVKLSQTKFCGVSAMVSKAVPISYVVILNGKEVGAGVADFP